MKAESGKIETHLGLEGTECPLRTTADGLDVKVTVRENKHAETALLKRLLRKKPTGGAVAGPFLWKCQWSAKYNCPQRGHKVDQTPRAGLWESVGESVELPAKGGMQDLTAR